MHVQDAAGDFARGRTRDEILRQQPNEKRLAIGRVWTGELAPKVDSFISQADPISRGYLQGHVVGAEDAPGGLDLGTSAADLERQIMSASEPGSSRAGPDDVDVSEVLAEIRAFRASVGSSPNQNTMRDALVRLRAARDAVDRQMRGRGTADAQHALRRMNDAARTTITRMNAAAAAFWGARNTALTQDNNWRRLLSGRDTTTRVGLERHARQGSSAAETVRVINERNKAFWSGR
jgi:hypothetical protein